MPAERGTLLHLFQSRVKDHPAKTALLELRGDTWRPTTWREWDSRARSLAAALIDDGLQPDEHVAIFCYSRREWVEADIAVMMAGARTVTIYHNVGRETVNHILADSRPAVVIAEGPLQIRNLFEKGDLVAKSIRRIVHVEERQMPAAKPGQPSPREVGLAETLPDTHRDLAVAYETYLERGTRSLQRQSVELERRIASVSPNAITKIVYTSGTTGEPKGAMLSHRNCATVVDSVDRILGIVPGDVNLMFLPLAHVYAQLAYHSQLQIGFTVAFARSMLTALEDAASLHPDFFCTVPRLFEKIHAGTMAQVERGSIVKRAVFDWAMDIGTRRSRVLQAREEVPRLLAIQAAIADKLVFSKLKDALGGRVRLVVSGGAACPRHLLEFFHAAGIQIIEGYGMTEGAALTNANRMSHYKFGTVGSAIDGVDVEIADDGEILVRGPGIMAGYLNKPEDTAEVLDAGGWLHTGDIGVLDEDGFLTITDRKRDIIITSGGKNIAPTPIEERLARGRLVSQALVFGDGKPYLVALFTMDKEQVEKFASENSLAAKGEALAADPTVRAAIDAEVRAVNATLDQYATIKRFALLPHEFSIDKGEVTPSLKLRRKVISSRYRELLESLYGGEPSRR
jgi:long-chain acyl-CoA synthetase